MEIKLTPQESEKFFHNALCNVGSDLRSCGLELDYNEKDYDKAKKSIQAKQKKGELPVETICIEDVLVEILRIGKKLTLVDEENGGAYTRSITLKDVHDRVQKTDAHWVMQMVNEQDDSTTAFEILQYVFLEESVFG